MSAVEQNFVEKTNYFRNSVGNHSRFVGKHKLVVLYKILHGLAQSYLFGIVTPQINETIDYIYN